jgi:inhibitor of KinA
MKALIPLGDRATLVYFPDEITAACFADAVRRTPDPWLVDVVQAYTSVAVYFDLDRTDFSGVSTRLRQIAEHELPARTPPSRLHVVPCCYELQLDMARVTQYTGLSGDEVIRLHTSTEYTVYAIGFCPGFPYLGYLPEALSGVPRLSSPRVRLEAGSVGLTGRQTGIYAEARPGGWNILGRTPLEIVNVADNYFPLRTVDRVRFRRIDEAEFQRLQGERLS